MRIEQIVTDKQLQDLSDLFRERAAEVDCADELAEALLYGSRCIDVFLTTLKESSKEAMEDAIEEVEFALEREEPRAARRAELSEIINESLIDGDMQTWTEAMREFLNLLNVEQKARMAAIIEATADHRKAYLISEVH